MSDAEQPEAERPRPRGEAAYTAHLEAIAQSNDRVKAAGKRERIEREQREGSQRRAEERRMDSDAQSQLEHHKLGL
ncbi:MAG: hypothetical protein ACXVRH_08060 [Thermoleophilaceae bacterium]